MIGVLISAALGGMVGTAIVCAPGRLWERSLGITDRRRMRGAGSAVGPGFVATSATLMGVLGWGAADARALTGLVVAGALLLLIAWLDLKYHIVPNRLVYPAALLVLCGKLVVAGGSEAFVSLCAGLGAFSLFLLAAWVSPAGLGGGDIKLAAFVGFLVGFPDVLTALVVAVFSGGLAAIGLLLAGKRGAIPYAPFLCLGAFVALALDLQSGLLALAHAI